MKNLEMYGVQEMDAKEMREVDGGILPLLIVAAAALLLSSCGNQTNISNGHSRQTNIQKNKVADTLHLEYHTHVHLK